MNKSGDTKAEFLKFLEGLSHKDWEIKVNSELLIKDFVSYIVGWEEEYAGVLIDSFKTGQKPWFLKTKDYSDFNKNSALRYKGYSPEKLLERWKYLIRVLESEIQDIGEENLRKNPDFSWLFDRHYLDYFKQIKKFISSSSEKVYKTK